MITLGETVLDQTQGVIHRYPNRPDWGDGPWYDEPDLVIWRNSPTWLPCMVIRHTSLGHLCGYCGVGRDHPYYKAMDSEVPVDVHGGVTWSNEMIGGPEDDKFIKPFGSVWWIGFDAGHSYDLTPSFKELGIGGIGSYKDIDYMRSECNKLAIQLGLLSVFEL
jgi:hypothetical protein